MEIKSEDINIDIKTFYVEQLDKTFIDYYVSSNGVITLMTNSYFEQLDKVTLRKIKQGLTYKVLKKHYKRLEKFREVK